MLRRLQLEDSRSRFLCPGQLAKHVDTLTISTPALEILDDALVDVRTGKHPLTIFTMPPQEGKSERVSRHFPHWMLLHDPDLRVASISAADSLARRWGKAVRNDILIHNDLGLKVRQDSAASNEWKLDGYKGGMITSSIGGILTGRPVDLMLIDDPHADQKEADSELMRDNVKDWWRTVGSTRLPPAGRVVLIQTRWHEDDLAGWLMAENPGRWRLINIPAQAEHDADRGEECKCGGDHCAGQDVLGRKPGEYMVSARGRDVADWEQRKAFVGSRGWNALYQGRPSGIEGAVLKREWWKFYDIPRAHERADGSMYAIGAVDVLISLDAAFKDTDQSDYVVFGVWARRGAEVWLLDLIREHMDFPTTIEALKQLAAKWPQAATKLIEDKANGPAIIATLAKEIPGILPYSPTDSKLARAHSVAPFIEAGNVWLPRADAAPWVGKFVQECADFPNGAYDDQVDMTTQALIRFYLLTGGAEDFMRQLAAEKATQPVDGAAIQPGPTYWSTATVR